MADIHDAKRIVGAIFDAMDAEDGADIGNGVSLFLPNPLTLTVTSKPDSIEVAFAPPADLYARRAFGLLNLHGTLEKLSITDNDVVARIEGLPDQSFRIVS